MFRGASAEETGTGKKKERGKRREQRLPRRCARTIMSSESIICIISSPRRSLTAENRSSTDNRSKHIFHSGVRRPGNFTPLPLHFPRAGGRRST